MQANVGAEEEQLQVNTGAEEEIASNRPVETGESDTGNRSEQNQLGRSGEEAPVQQEQEKANEPEQQPIQPEDGRETGTE